ncbi:helix-turn-helix transcriptional regulator [Nonomuraea typhae]|uniref:helix-turn-helix transcriptional regulator n=1 Tax=Nonomuraea typhae TaxID=2603600 RepID=UPI001FEBFF03|nr:winged helix-turn-helix domain-containing protein [Nonomuraea typhae]
MNYQHSAADTTPAEGGVRGSAADDGSASSWSFLTHHARVLVEIARDPEVRLRDVAASIGATERTVQAIVRDLCESGYLTRARVGRRNTYALHPDLNFRRPSEAGVPIGRLLQLFTGQPLTGPSHEHQT